MVESGHYELASGGRQAPADESRFSLGRPQRILLEVATVFYFFARNAAIPLSQQYVYHLVAIKYNLTGLQLLLATTASRAEEFDDGELTAPQRRLADATTNSLFNVDYNLTVTEIVNRTVHEQIDDVTTAVSYESSLIILYLTIAELLPATVVVLFFGGCSNSSDRRKFLMWLPCVGSALYALGFLLPGYINGADIDQPVTMVFFVVASILCGLSGSLPGFLAGNAAYISDTDLRRSRTVRLAIVELSMGLTFGVVSLINGLWIAAVEKAGVETNSQHRPPPAFEQPLWFVFACSLTSFVIIYFLLRVPAAVPQLNGADQAGVTLTTSTDVISTSSAESIATSTCFRFCDFRGIRRAIGLRTSAQRKLWAVVAAYQLFVFVHQGQERTLVLFLQNKPIQDAPDDIGFQLFVLYVLAGIGSWPGVPLLQRFVDDLTIAAIAVVSKLAGSLLTAFATNDALVYVASVVQLFHLAPYAVARSIASQQMGDDEQGSVYALIHSLHSVVAFLGQVIHTALYTGTLDIMSGLVFIVSGLFLIIPLILFSCTRYIERKEEEEMQNADVFTSVTYMSFDLTSTD